MKKIIIGFSIFTSLFLLNANADDFELSDKEKQKIIEDREKAKKMKATAVENLTNEKYFMDLKYNILMNCFNNVSSTNDIKDCNDTLKMELKKEQDKMKQKQKEKEEYEKKIEEQKELQEKLIEDREKEEERRKKEQERELSKKQKEQERELAKKQKENNFEPERQRKD